VLEEEGVLVFLVVGFEGGGDEGFKGRGGEKREVESRKRKWGEGDDGEKKNMGKGDDGSGELDVMGLVGGSVR
uniref:hypothetical protein n=1 Tax=Neisseria sicca TaxID=490 RepID=UPI001C9994B6